MKTGRPPKHVGCSVPGCDRKHRARGWCSAHYRRFQRTGYVGRPEMHEKYPQAPVCAVKSCERVSMAKGYCDAHYQRLRAYGDVQADKPIRPRVGKGENSRWMSNHGYVTLVIDGRRVAEHRLVMERAIGRPLTKCESVLPQERNQDRQPDRKS